ncbi:MAG: alginate export family protein [Gammaproteobacteria bacterium]|nr:alginate export family protein [Gammaproteobacteria bacterium]
MRLSFVVVCLTLASTAVVADDECPDASSCDNHRYSADVRIRYGNINDNINKDANTLTGRLLMTFRTPQVGNFRAVFAAEHVNDFGIDTYNDGGTNGRYEYATEVDPSGTELDEAFIEYKRESALIRYGRQYINHGKLPQRYLGTVAWRQNHQTYDALSIDAKFAEKFRLELALVEKAYRVFGRDHPSRAIREWDLDGIAIRGTYPVPKFADVTGYVYNLDFDDNRLLSTRTIGLMAEGPCRSDPSKFGWSGACKIEVATQSALHESVGFDRLLYAHSSVGVDFSNFRKENTTGSISFSATVLDGDGEYSFKTPLATLHGYAGAADKFLVNTPPDGLRDVEIRIKERLLGWDVTVGLHRFNTLFKDLPTYGTEVDIAATRTFGKYKWILKFADYQANEEWKPLFYGIDATKFWATVQFSL